MTEWKNTTSYSQGAGLMETTETWISVTDQLPQTSVFTSRPLLFMANGKQYAGHYHDNGWFYCDDTGFSGIMAWGGTLNGKVRPRRSFSGGDLAQWPDVTHWRYLREDA